MFEKLNLRLGVGPLEKASSTCVFRVADLASKLADALIVELESF